MPNPIHDIKITNNKQDHSLVAPYMRFFLASKNFDEKNDYCGHTSGSTSYKDLARCRYILQRNKIINVEVDIGIDKDNNKGILLRLSKDYYDLISSFKLVNSMRFYPSTYHIFAYGKAISELFALVEILRQATTITINPEESSNTIYTYSFNEPIETRNPHDSSQLKL